MRSTILAASLFVFLTAPAFGDDAKAPKPAFATVKALIGKGPESAEMLAFKKELTGEPKLTKFTDCFFHEWQDHGVCFRFEKDAVTSFFFYADKADGYKQYKGELPEKLTFASTRADVEKALGEPKKSGGDGVIPFWIGYPAKGIDVTFESKDVKDMKNKIHHITIFPPRDK